MTSSASPPPVEFECFEGPLDLLLDEVRRQNVAIERIAMAPIVARFLEYTRTAAERSLHLDIEWLHMAATLIHWKSRSLLPSNPDGRLESDAIRDNLVQQLLSHRKQAAEELGRRQSLEQARFSRPTDVEVREMSQADQSEDAPFVSVWDMIQEARELARWAGDRGKERSQPQEAFGVDADEVTVAAMVEYLWAELAAGGESILDGTKLLWEQPTASRRCCLLLGMLEMVRERQLQVEQKELFGPMLLSPGVGSGPTVGIGCEL
jgi:segregation and condensation protein A